MRPPETHPVDVDLIRGLEVIQHALDQLEGLEAGSTNQTQEGLAVAAARMAEIAALLAGYVVRSFRGMESGTDPDDSGEGFGRQALGFEAGELQ